MFLSLQWTCDYARTAPLVGVKALDLTWVFAPATPLDEADDEEDQYDEGDGTHQANEPALSGYVYLVYVGCRHRTHTHRVGQEKWEKSECIYEPRWVAAICVISERWAKVNNSEPTSHYFATSSYPGWCCTKVLIHYNKVSCLLFHYTGCEFESESVWDEGLWCEKSHLGMVSVHRERMQVLWKMQGIPTLKCECEYWDANQN